jgi:O-antigen ligase
MFKSITNIISEVRNWHTGKMAKVLNSSILLFMGIYIFANSLPLSAINELCYYLSILALLILIGFKKTTFSLRTPLTLPFFLFALWALLGLFFTLDFKNTLHDLRGHLLEYLIVFYLLVNYFNSPKRLKILAMLAIASATIFSVGAIIQYYFIEGRPFSSRLGVSFSGEMNSAYLGFTTIFGICLSLHFLYKSKNIFYKILLVNCFFIMSITTFLTQSRGSLLGFLAALLILCFHNKKNMIFIIITIILIIIFLPETKERATNIDGFTKDIRVKMNRLTMEVIKDHPIVGIGFGMEIFGNKDLVPLEKYNSKLPLEYQQHGGIVGSAHNTILDIAVRTGVVGLVLFLYILITSLWMLWKTLKLKQGEYFKSWAICLFACFVSFMIPALFEDTTYGPRVVIFYTILAMITILWNIVQKKTNEHAAPVKLDMP